MNRRALLYLLTGLGAIVLGTGLGLEATRAGLPVPPHAPILPAATGTAQMPNAERGARHAIPATSALRLPPSDFSTPPTPGSSGRQAPASCTLTGAITPGDLLHTTTINGLQSPGICGNINPCDTTACCATWYSDVYTFTNPLGVQQCITVTISNSGCGGERLFSAAYLGSYHPDYPCVNCVADVGVDGINGTVSYSFDVPAFTVFAVEVENYDSGQTCPSYSLSVSGTIACPPGTPTPTVTGTPPTATRTPLLSSTPTPGPTACSVYQFTQATGTIVPGTQDIGNYCDDCSTLITLPFAYQLYDQSFTTAQAGSNGQLAFGTDAPSWNQITCLPNPAATYVIAPYWTDQDTRHPNCSSCGIYTSVSGSVPNRIFNIEWRNVYFHQGDPYTLDYEVRLYEGQTRFDLIYGQVTTTANNDTSLTVGVQKTSALYTQIGCDPTGGQNPPVSTGQMHTFTLVTCATPTRTATPGGPTVTPTATPTCGLGTPGPWAQASPQPLAIDSSSAAADAVYAYNAGGYYRTLRYVVDQFSRYDPLTDAWTSLTPMPRAADGPATVYSPINNKVYVFGGADDGRSGRGDTRIYDIASGTWATGAPMPGPRTRFAGQGYANGKIYLVGGGTDTDYYHAQGQTWEYDPLSDTWSTMRASLPVALMSAASGVVDGHLFVIGGTDVTALSVNRVYDYDIAANTWTSRPAMPVAVSSAGSATLATQIYIFGGGTFSKARTDPREVMPEAPLLRTTQIFDTGSYTWSSGPDLNTARWLLTGTQVGGDLIAIGGYSYPDDQASVEVARVKGSLCGTTTPTVVPSPTGTSAPSPTCTSTPTGTPSAPPSATRTGTLTSTRTAGPGATRTNAAVPSSTPTRVTAPTGTPPAPPTATLTLCPLPFSDVQPTDYFYGPVQYLYCHGVISGYADGTFRPYTNTTRAQMVKIVVLGFGISSAPPPAGGYAFADVPPGFPFFGVIETAAAHHIVSGYSCGGAGEPCDGQRRPYFRPYANVTRGQLAKIDVVAAGWLLLTPTLPTFTDVAPRSPFYSFIETAVCHGVVSGYADHNFRPRASATRGQISKIVYLSVSAGGNGCGALVSR